MSCSASRFVRSLCSVCVFCVCLFSVFVSCLPSPFLSWSAVRQSRCPRCLCPSPLAHPMCVCLCTTLILATAHATHATTLFAPVCLFVFADRSINAGPGAPGKPHSHRYSHTHIHIFTSALAFILVCATFSSSSLSASASGLLVCFVSIQAIHQNSPRPSAACICWTRSWAAGLLVCFAHPDEASPAYRQDDQPCCTQGVGEEEVTRRGLRIKLSFSRSGLLFFFHCLFFNNLHFSPIISTYIHHSTLLYTFPFTTLH